MVSVQDTSAMAMAPVPMPMMPHQMPSQMQVGQLQPQLQQQQQGMNEIRTLFITGLPHDASDRELYLLFMPCEGYDKSMIVRKDDGKQPYGFVNFTSVIAAEAAKAKLNGIKWDPQESLRLKCELSNKTPDWSTASYESATLYVTGVPETVSKELFDAFVAGQVGGIRYTSRKRSAFFVGFLSREQAKTGMGLLEGCVWTHEGESFTLRATFARRNPRPRQAPSTERHLDKKTLYVTGVPETVSKELFDAFIAERVGMNRYTSRKNSAFFVGFLCYEPAKAAMELLEGCVWTHEGESFTLRATFAYSNFPPPSAEYSCPKKYLDSDRKLTPKLGKPNGPRGMLRAGIIPYYNIEDRLWFILGVSSEFDELADFGGAVKQDEPWYEGGTREFLEESFGLLNPVATDSPACHLHTENCVLMFLQVNPPEDGFQQSFEEQYKRCKQDSSCTPANCEMSSVWVGEASDLGALVESKPDGRKMWPFLRHFLEPMWGDILGLLL